MNKIYNLLDENYVTKLFKKEVLPQYQDFIDIKKVKILPIKEYIWQTTYHVVLEFKTTFIRSDKKIKKLSLFCSAHSNEPRKNSFTALKFLWDNNFSKGNLTTPRPLFYSKNFNAFFYRGVKGNSLYYFIHEKKISEIEKIIPKAAALLAKLHGLPILHAKNFNQENSRIETVFPGMFITLERIKNLQPKFYPLYEKIYFTVNNKEKEFFSRTKRRWLVHGDAHPENIIKVSKNKIAIIDFTDICLADFARDLGSFLQQLEFMGQHKINDPSNIKKMQDLFLKNYLTITKISLDASLKERIKYYYNWTALRTANLFLLKEESEPDRARGLIEKICQDLKIDITL